MIEYKARFTRGVDDPVLDALARGRTQSIWLAEALEAFFQAFGPEDVGERSQEAAIIKTYSAQLPKWAAAYLERLGNHSPRLIRAAAWFYLGQKSMNFDLNELLAEMKRVIDLDPDLIIKEPITDEDRALVERLTGQF